jgi:hypothetical protein
MTDRQFALKEPAALSFTTDSNTSIVIFRNHFQKKLWEGGNPAGNETQQMYLGVFCILGEGSGLIYLACELRLCRS